jgi:hypothetical protein
MTTIDRSQDSLSWSEVINLTHAEHVERFGWCSCEDNEGQENPYDDCPKSGADKINGEKFYTVSYTEQQVYSLTIEAATAEDALRIARGLPMDDNWTEIGVVDSFYQLEGFRVKA